MKNLLICLLMTSFISTIAFASESEQTVGEVNTDCPAMRGDSDRRNDKDQSSSVKPQPKSKTSATAQ